MIGCPMTACIVLPQKSCGNKIPVPRVSPGNRPLAKEPEDSGYEIAVKATTTTTGKTMLTNSEIRSSDIVGYRDRKRLQFRRISF